MPIGLGCDLERVPYLSTDLSYRSGRTDAKLGDKRDQKPGLESASSLLPQLQLRNAGPQQQKAFCTPWCFSSKSGTGCNPTSGASKGVLLFIWAQSTASLAGRLGDRSPKETFFPQHSSSEAHRMEAKQRASKHSTPQPPHFASSCSAGSQLHDRPTSDNCKRTSHQLWGMCQSGTSLYPLTHPKLATACPRVGSLCS